VTKDEELALMRADVAVLRAAVREAVRVLPPNLAVAGVCRQALEATGGR
jgi:hypothetical protein